MVNLSLLKRQANGEIGGEIGEENGRKAKLNQGTTY